MSEIEYARKMRKLGKRYVMVLSKGKPLYLNDMDIVCSLLRDEFKHENPLIFKTREYIERLKRK